MSIGGERHFLRKVFLRDYALGQQAINQQVEMLSLKLIQQVY